MQSFKNLYDIICVFEKKEYLNVFQVNHSNPILDKISN